MTGSARTCFELALQSRERLLEIGQPLAFLRRRPPSGRCARNFRCRAWLRRWRFPAASSGCSCRAAPAPRPDRSAPPSAPASVSSPTIAAAAGGALGIGRDQLRRVRRPQGASAAAWWRWRGRRSAALACCSSSGSLRAGLMSISPRICRTPSTTCITQCMFALGRRHRRQIGRDCGHGASMMLVRARRRPAARRAARSPR